MDCIANKHLPCGRNCLLPQLCDCWGRGGRRLTWFAALETLTLVPVPEATEVPEASEPDPGPETAEAGTAGAFGLESRGSGGTSAAAVPP